ncbi:MAG: hypothetical protein ABSH19_00930 [Opitutales bacterium]|jgi:hypothetical protein
MFRPASIALCTAAALAAGAVVRAQSGAAPIPAGVPAVVATSHPAWVDDTLEPDGRARISRVVAGSPDIVVLDRGLYAGLRVGSPCLVDRNGTSVAELIVVATQPDCAVALITDQTKGITLQSGDQVRLKTITHVI